MNGKLQKNGGNLASYFCTPNGGVIHAVAGPVSPETLLTEARWAVEAFQTSAGDKEVLQALHRDHNSQSQTHRFLARNPLSSIDDIYDPFFELIVGQRVSVSRPSVTDAQDAVRSAKELHRPMLLIVHRNAEKEKVLKEWQWLSSYPENAAERPLADLAAVYSVVFIALEDLPAVSHDLRIQPVEVATSQNTLRESERFVSCVVTRSDGRQVASTPKFLREPLVMAMAEGLVEEIKINPRSSKEMQELYKVVAPVSRDLGEQLLERVQRPRPLASNF